MKFYLVRHGEKAAGNHYNPILRHNDQPLNALGREQAEIIGERFQKGSIQAVYVSEYLRTQETARPLARKLGLAPIQDARLNEIDNGIVENLSLDDLRESHPEVWKAYQDQESDFQWPGGESGLEAQERIVSFFREHADRNGALVILAHDGIIRVLVCWVLGMPVYRRSRLRVDTASITEVDWDQNAGSWTLIRLNQGIT